MTQGAPGPVSARQVERTAVALVTAHLGREPQAVIDEVLRDVPGEELASFLGSVAAWMIRETSGGERWLQRFGLAVADEGEQ